MRVSLIQTESNGTKQENEEGVLTIDLDLEEQRKYREEIPVLEQI